MKLGEVITLNKNSLVNINDDKTYRILGVQSYGKGVVIRKRVLGSTLTMRKYKVAKPNQLMWCKVDTKNGAFGVTTEAHDGCVASTNMALADIDLDKAYPPFIELLFRNEFFYESVNDQSTGTTNRKYLKPWEVCDKIEIPDLSVEQQKLLVTKYEMISESRLISRIENNKLLAARLRQAILREGMQGKLVPQNPDDEPASVLLEKIQEEKQRLYKEGKIRKPKKLPPIKPEEIPYDLPEGWVVEKLGNIFFTTSGGTPSRSHPEYWEGEIPFLKSGELDDNMYITEYEECITESGLTNSSATVFEKGSVVMALYGATAGKLGILGISTTTNQAVCNFFELENFDTHFLYYQLLSLRKKIVGDCFGGAQPNISQTYLKQLAFMVPPLAEQKRIVEIIQKLMDVCDMVDERITENQKHTVALMNAVLREAFETSDAVS